MKTTNRLITHSGSFHADDVFACAVLSRLFPVANVIRTRDAAILNSTTDRDIVFDVGYEYDPVRRRYDHHQPGRPLREDGAPYSSFGLVWLHHGRNYIAACVPGLDSEGVEAVWANTDSGFVTEIDHGDNGYVPPGGKALDLATSAAFLVDDFNPGWNERHVDVDMRFQEAVSVFSQHLERRIKRAAAAALAEKAVLAAFHEAADPRIVVVPDYMPVGSVIGKYGFDEVLYLVERSRSGDWFVNCVHPEGEPFGQRKPLPESWAGLRGRDLAAVTGVEDAVFCHLKRFTAGASSKESAIRLARLAVGEF